MNASNIFERITQFNFYHTQTNDHNNRPDRSESTYVFNIEIVVQRSSDTQHNGQLNDRENVSFYKTIVEINTIIT